VVKRATDYREQWDGRKRRRAGPAPESHGHAKAQEHPGDPPPPPPWPDPVPLPEAPGVGPFPTCLFPEKVAGLISDGAAALSCPEDYLGLPVLVIAGAAVGASRCLEVKPGWRERPALYGAVVGPPGSAKSPALKLVAGPLYDDQRRLHEHYRRQLAAHEDGASDSKPKESVRYISDCTVEKLGEVLQDNPRGVVLVRDELTAWTTGMNQYRARGSGSDRQFYLAAWAGEPVSVRRKNPQSPPVFVAHPFLAVLGGLPPATLPRLQGDRDTDDGFLDRLLFAYPRPTPAVGETWECVEEDVVAGWAGVLKALWGLQPEDHPEHGTRPRRVYLTREARRGWEDFTGRLASELNDDSFPDCLRGPWSKFRGYCARLALVMHCLRRACGEAGGEDVDADSLDRAAELVAYFQGQARKVYATMGADRTLPDARATLDRLPPFRGCVDSVDGQYRVSKRDLQVVVWAGNRTLEQVDAVVNCLVRHGLLRPAAARDREGPGRPPSPSYEIHPSVFSRAGASTESTKPQNGEA
jgi:hypothetical protein